jgi:uncharacterized protein YndB with AHSA1/START domain
MNGTLRRVGDHHEIRFERRYARPMEKVFAALTVPERLATWLANAEIDPRAGGAIVFVFDDPRARMEGRVTVWDPSRLFAFTWPSGPGAEESQVRFELSPDGDGCRLVLTQTFLTADIVPSVGAGWHEHLERFEIALDGVTTTRWDRGRERVLKARYRAMLL